MLTSIHFNRKKLIWQINFNINLANQLLKRIIKFSKLIIMPIRLSMQYNKRSSKIKLTKIYQFFQEILLKNLLIIISLRKVQNYNNMNLASIDSIIFHYLNQL